MADWTRMVHGIGDLHAGGVKRPRVAALLEDAATLSTPAAHLQIGRTYPLKDAIDNEAWELLRAVKAAVETQRRAAFKAYGEGIRQQRQVAKQTPAKRRSHVRSLRGRGSVTRAS